MPHHHRTVEIRRRDVDKGYGGVRAILSAGPGLWMIVAAAPVDAENVPGAGMIRVVSVNTPAATQSARIRPQPGAPLQGAAA